MRKYRLWNAFSHGSIVLSVVFIILFAIDRINPSMGFIGSDHGDWLLLLLCIMSLTNGVITAAHLIRRENNARRRKVEDRYDEDR